MAYTINKTDGTVFATVPDGTINTDSSVTIIGKNYAGYGAFLGENIIRLLENAASATAPIAPLDGQLWFDKTAGLLKVFSGTVFKDLGSTISDSVAPTSPVTGDMWFDTGNNQLNIYDGTDFILIGPAFSSTGGTSGPIVETVVDDVAGDHIVVKHYIDGVVVAITSKDVTFTLDVPITGFTTIAPGIQLASIVSGTTPNFTGAATDSELLGGALPSTYLKSDAADTTSGTLGILNDGGLIVGAASEGELSVDTGVVILSNLVSDGDLLIQVNDGGVPTTAITVDGASARARVSAPLVDADIANRLYVNDTVSAATLLQLNKNGSNQITGVITPNTNGTLNFGAVANKFATIYATTFNGEATTAQYADLAERFESDSFIAPGTVVQLGGAKEITEAVEDLSTDVFGVISTTAGFLMNAGAGDEETHPKVAMSGRVPVRVIGTVNKGDRLVSAGNGLARAALLNEMTSFNVIGRSLDNKTTTGEGVIEAIVTVN